MVRLSGVFTVIGLYFNSCPKLGPAATASNEVATIALSKFAAILSSEILPRVANYIFKYVLWDQAVLTVAELAWAVKPRLGAQPRHRPASRIEAPSYVRFTPESGHPHTTHN